ncbi:general transcription factor IIH subunit 1-like [Haliotis rubra]|uniref:general transcription factor IIH subunit 1-like n=1 Tax=Haliotis rubra TaxID=36100 RepID=UPI001EE5377F|nr:general transcription factor IIH subunit 1-like [Haliotis rubra]XP_046581674.1 general transcription factor IIH subunit 1-like [Haliotis rubra]XP_046581676.1 general transcription factor IIH subunit 1-like [Haliotis rubra]
MSRSSEEVLLIVNHVRQKKTDGTLYLMGTRLAWMPGGKNSFTISHMYANIKTQKISPDTKDKVQLQLVMHDGGANTFHFNNAEGRAAQIRDRDSVKELLQQLLPKFRIKISSELEEKNRMLQEDPELFQLYKDLVVSQVISAEEFWASRAHKFTNSTSKPETKQVVGISPAFLADIKPQTDGCNGLKYNLNADIIESIFRTYPMVKRKHAEYVPHKMTESEFWTRFFQSHYFHRDRTHTGTKDLFSECAKNDDEDMKEEISRNVSDPLIDLSRIRDTAIEEGYRGMVEDSRKSNNVTNLSMIRRFNHHSTMVLRAYEVSTSNSSLDESSKTSNGESSLQNGSSVEVATPSTSKGHSGEPDSKKRKIQEKLEYSDLQNDLRSNHVNLRLGKMERYLHGPTPVMAAKYTTSENVMQALRAVGEEIQHWNPQLTQVLQGGQAMSILSELSPGGALMKGTSQQQLHQMIPRDVQEEIKQQYSALCELLRHFWTCFPPSSKFVEEKIGKMRTTLEKFQLAKLNPLKAKLASYHYSVDLCGHMEEMLQAAYNKFDAWQAKKLSRR